MRCGFTPSPRVNEISKDQSLLLPPERQPSDFMSVYTTRLKMKTLRKAASGRKCFPALDEALALLQFCFYLKAQTQKTVTLSPLQLFISSVPVLHVFQLSV